MKIRSIAILFALLLPLAAHAQYDKDVFSFRGRTALQDGRLNEGVFVGSGIFKSGNPRKRAAAIVQAVTNYKDAKLLAELSEDLGEAMVGINEHEIELLMAERGK